MKNKKKIFSLLTLLLGFAIQVSSQDAYLKSIDWQIGAGSTYLYDEYLSPISYNGFSMRFSSENQSPVGKTSDNGQYKWYLQNNLKLLPALAVTRSGSSLYHFQLDARSNLLFKFYRSDRFEFDAGASVALRGGGRFIRQTRNNPGSAELMSDIGMSCVAKYSFSLWGKPVSIRYNSNLAIAGLAFSPEYAQSYYEIFYLGNYDNTLKFTSLHNKLHWVQQLNLDIPVNGKQSGLRISYWNEGRVSVLNEINTNILSDQLTVGYIKYFKVL